MTALAGRRVQLDRLTFETVVTIQPCGHYEYRFIVIKHLDNLDAALFYQDRQMDMISHQCGGPPVQALDADELTRYDHEGGEDR